MRWIIPRLKKVEITDVWFAWHPVNVANDRYVWWECVLRTRWYSRHRWFRGFAWCTDYSVLNTERFERSYYLRQESVV